MLTEDESSGEEDDEDESSDDEGEEDDEDESSEKEEEEQQQQQQQQQQRRLAAAGKVRAAATGSQQQGLMAGQEVQKHNSDSGRRQLSVLPSIPHYHLITPSDLLVSCPASALPVAALVAKPVISRPFPPASLSSVAPSP